jgi:hypothetical protein
VRESFLKLIELWNVVVVTLEKVLVGSKVVVIDRVDKKVVVLNLDVGSEAGVDGCYDLL